MENEIKNEIQDESVARIDKLKHALEQMTKSRDTIADDLKCLEEKFVGCSNEGVYIPFALLEVINTLDDNDLGAIIRAFFEYCRDYAIGSKIPDPYDFISPDDRQLAFYLLLTKMVL